MKPLATIPIATTLAPAALAAPPLLLLGALAAVLWLLLDSEEGGEVEPAPDKPAPEELTPENETREEAVPDAPEAPQASKPQSPRPIAPARRIMREDLAEALAYGERRLTRKEAVGALEALGFRKTSAYKALSPDGRFGSLIEITPDGLVAWNG
jgi:hypothetical protein